MAGPDAAARFRPSLCDTLFADMKQASKAHLARVQSDETLSEFI
jgi:hypothetical protein